MHVTHADTFLHPYIEKNVVLMTDKCYLILFKGLFSAHIATGFDCYGNKVTFLGFNPPEKTHTHQTKRRLKVITFLD